MAVAAVRIVAGGVGATVRVGHAAVRRGTGHRLHLQGGVADAETLAQHHGLDRKLAGVRPLGVAVLGMNDDPSLTLDRLVEVSQELMELDRADVIVLGCGTLSFRALDLQAEIGIPVVNPLRSAIKLCELLVSSGLSHSKRSYPVPPKLLAAAGR